MGRHGTLFQCVECGAQGDKLATGWRAYFAGELDEDDGEEEVLMFCPDCAEREFGPFGREERS